MEFGKSPHPEVAWLGWDDFSPRKQAAILFFLEVELAGIVCMIKRAYSYFDISGDTKRDRRMRI